MKFGWIYQNIREFIQIASLKHLGCIHKIHPKHFSTGVVIVEKWTGTIPRFKFTQPKTPWRRLVSDEIAELVLCLLRTPFFIENKVSPSRYSIEKGGTVLSKLTFFNKLERAGWSVRLPQPSLSMQAAFQVFWMSTGQPGKYWWAYDFFGEFMLTCVDHVWQISMLYMSW